MLRRWDGERWTDERSVRIGSKLPGGPRWWATALIVIAAAAVPIGSLALALAGFYALSDPGETTRRPQPTVDVAAESCQELTVVLERRDGPRVDAIRVGNRAIQELTSAIDATGPGTLAGEVTTGEWLADWDAIVEQRELFAVDLENGARAQFREPRTADGMPISIRMIEASPTECRRAVMLAIRP